MMHTFYFSCISRPSFKIVSYNFFASYHGYSRCDAIAAHSKKKTNVIARDEKKVMDTAVKLCEAINLLKNTTATPVHIYDEEKRAYKTMDGITQVATCSSLMDLGTHHQLCQHRHLQSSTTYKEVSCEWGCYAVGR